jgi:hypothetical protein
VFIVDVIAFALQKAPPSADFHQAQVAGEDQVVVVGVVQLSPK